MENIPGFCMNLMIKPVVEGNSGLAADRHGPGQENGGQEHTMSGNHLFHKSRFLIADSNIHFLTTDFLFAAVPGFAVWFSSLLPLPVTSLPLSDASDTTPRIRDFCPLG
jgi:hypothetical protein